mgnify:CR=1 FL=1
MLRLLMMSTHKAFGFAQCAEKCSAMYCLFIQCETSDWVFSRSRGSQWCRLLVFGSQTLTIVAIAGKTAIDSSDFLSTWRQDTNELCQCVMVLGSAVQRITSMVSHKAGKQPCLSSTHIGGQTPTVARALGNSAARLLMAKPRILIVSDSIGG